MSTTEGLEFLEPVAEELAEAISAYYPSPDHVDEQTSPREVADSLLTIVYRAVIDHGAFDEVERLRQVEASAAGVVEAWRKLRPYHPPMAAMLARPLDALSASYPSEIDQVFQDMAEDVARRFAASPEETPPAHRDRLKES